MNAILFDIERNSYVDGPGIRTTVFFKGCNLNCLWCHNPESQAQKPQMLFYQDLCQKCGKCAKVCLTPETCTLCGNCTFYCPADAKKVCGKTYTPDEVLSEILKDKTFYETSGGGVTFSGGECMLQVDFLLEILKKCKENGIHTAVDTAGHVSAQSFTKILPYTDLFLYDIKLMDLEKHRVYTGADNLRILENLKMLLRSRQPVWIRIPVISGVNDSEEEMGKIREFLIENGEPEKIELLPYHALGAHKYAAIGRQAQTFSTPSAETIAYLQSLLHLS